MKYLNKIHTNLLTACLFLIITACTQEEISPYEGAPGNYNFTMVCGDALDFDTTATSRVSYYDAGTYPLTLHNRWEFNEENGHSDHITAIHIKTKQVFSLGIREIVNITEGRKNVAVFEVSNLALSKGIKDGDEVALIYGGRPGEHDIELGDDNTVHLMIRNQVGDLKNLANRDFMCARSRIAFQKDDSGEYTNNVHLEPLVEDYTDKTGAHHVDFGIDVNIQNLGKRRAILMKKLNTLFCIKMFFKKEAFETMNNVDDGLVAVTMRMPVKYDTSGNGKHEQDNVFFQYYRLNIANPTHNIQETPYEIEGAVEGQHNEYLRLNFPQLITPKPNGNFNWQRKEGEDGKTHEFIDYNGITIEKAKLNGKEGYLITSYMAVTPKPIPGFPIFEAFTRDHVYYRTGIKIRDNDNDNDPEDAEGYRMKPGAFIPVFVDFSDVDYTAEHREIEKHMPFNTNFPNTIKDMNTYCSRAISMTGFDFSLAPGLVWAKKVNTRGEEDINGTWTYGVYDHQGESRIAANVKESTYPTFGMSETFGEYFVWGDVVPTGCAHQERTSLSIPWSNYGKTSSIKYAAPTLVNKSNYRDVAMLTNPIYRTASVDELKRISQEFEQASENSNYYLAINRGDETGYEFVNEQNETKYADGVFIGTKEKPSVEEQDHYFFFIFTYGLEMQRVGDRLTDKKNEHLYTYYHGTLNTLTNSTDYQMSLWSTAESPSNTNQAFRFFMAASKAGKLRLNNGDQNGYIDKRYPRVLRPIIF